MIKSHLKLVPPTEVNRTVVPTRRPNAELRTRERPTAAEVEASVRDPHSIGKSLHEINGPR
jgi:type 1 fimbriae regulatory protein FimB/type 1 fimbriae regulatory protein FimE